MADMETYENPLITRYASKEMSALFSPKKKFSTWRQLWVTLAESQKRLGLNIITDEQLKQMRDNVDNIDFDRAREIEKETRHDVMAHIRAFGEVAPDAEPIIHLGATSAFVTDNTDCIVIKEALELTRKRLAMIADELCTFALDHAKRPCRGYTHFQVAQPTTVGKRACLWLQDLMIDIEDMTHLLETIKFRGAKGTTGTQASYLALFDGDMENVEQLDRLMARKFGFGENNWAVTGQTYPRKQDARVLNVLAGIGASAMKFAVDLRLLSNRGEMFEPFGKGQVGSSAMPYKRNPMRSERITALGRYLITISLNGALTASSQWFERTLDDSANRRIVIAEAFLAVDGILRIYHSIAAGLDIDETRIARHVDEDLPWIMTENLMMEVVKAGGNRQEAHEAIRKCTGKVREDMPDAKPAEVGAALLKLISEDDAFKDVKVPEELKAEDYIGHAYRQTRNFVRKQVRPVVQDLVSDDDEKPAELEV